MLIGEAAKAKGLSPDQFSEAEIKRRVNPVTEGQIVSFFQQNQGQMQGRDLAAMNPPSGAISKSRSEAQHTGRW